MREITIHSDLRDSFSRIADALAQLADPNPLPPVVFIGKCNNCQTDTSHISHIVGAGNVTYFVASTTQVLDMNNPFMPTPKLKTCLSCGLITFKSDL